MSVVKNDAMYLASADVIAAACRLETTVRQAPSAEAFRQEMLGLLRQLVARCRELGIADAETAEARYALVAFIDDRVLRSSWIGRAEWTNNPLQLELFREYTAGENFFARMDHLMRRGPPFRALEVYYLCMALGFAGALSDTRGKETVRAYLDAARSAVLEGRAAGRFAPNAVPRERRRRDVRPPPVAVASAIAAAVLVAAGFAALSWSLGTRIERAEHALSADAPPPIAPRGGE